MCSTNASFEASTVVSTVMEQQDCQAINQKTGEICGEREGLCILNEFQKLYRARIEKIDNEPTTEFNQVSMKFQIMSEWIKDLEEQNTMLVHTVEDLERAACSRVKLLETKLQQSLEIVSGRMIRSSHFEEETCDVQQVRYLKQQIEQLKASVKQSSIHQAELEEKIMDLTEQLHMKDETIKVYVTKFQNFTDNLKKRPKLTNHIILDSITASIESESNMILMADIVENVLIQKDCEIENLRQQLQHVESKITDTVNVQIQLKEKDRKIQEIEHRITCLQKESLETREALTTEVAEKHDSVMLLRKQIAILEEQYHHAKMQAHFKDDIIKEMRKELKQTALKETSVLEKIHVDSDTTQKKAEIVDTQTNRQQDEIILYLTNTKLLMEKEKEALFNLNNELEDILQHLITENKEVYNLDVTDIYKKLQDIEMLIKNYKSDVIDHSTTSTESISNFIEATESELKNLYEILQTRRVMCCKDKNTFCVHNMTKEVEKKIDTIAKMYSEKNAAITIVDQVKIMISDYICCDSRNIVPNAVLAQQFKLMEEFRVCTVEAQTAIEDIREEISTIVPKFSSRHQKYVELNEMIGNVQSQLLKTRDSILQTINKFELQESEKMWHGDKIVNKSEKLKKMKNKFNTAQSELNSCINNMQDTIQECGMFKCIEVCTCSDLLGFIAEEVEHIVDDLQVFQKQECCSKSMLMELKNQFCWFDSSIKNLYKNMNEILLDDEITQTMFCETEEKLEKLEGEIDCAHTKMQDVLETFLTTRQDCFMNTIESQNQCQMTNEVIKTKQDLHKLKIEYDNLKLKTLQETCQITCNEKTKWKSRVAELEEQLAVLQHETECKEEANNFLKRIIESMEKEICIIQVKVENSKRRRSIDNMQFKKKIFELENKIKTQKEVECNLEKTLSDGESELEKSENPLESFYRHPDVDKVLFNWKYHLKNKNISPSMSQYHKVLQDVIQEIQINLNRMKSNLDSSISSCCVDSGNSPVLLMFEASSQLKKCAETLNYPLIQIQKLDEIVSSTNKLLEEMKQMIQNQKNSLAVSQDKINMQDLLISQLNKEKEELQKENAMQVETIGYLQGSVVEANKCLDHMGHKTVDDLYNKNDSIHILTMYVDETQIQYNECFAEAAAQDNLLELQREAISQLQLKIRNMDYEKNLIIILLHFIYYSILTVIKDQLALCMDDFQTLKCKIHTLTESNICLENKYVTAKNFGEETDRELQKLKILVKHEHERKEYDSKCCQCNVNVAHKDCMTEDLVLKYSYINLTTSNSRNSSHKHDLRVEIESLIRDNEKMKKQLQKYKLDFEIVDEELKTERENNIYIVELKTELQRKSNIEDCLKFENQKLKIELDECMKRTVDLVTELQLAKQKESNFEKHILELEDAQNEKMLYTNEKEFEKYISELINSKELLSILRDQIYSLKVLVKEKSDNADKLQGDYEVLQNNHLKLKTEHTIMENKAEKEICQLKKRLQEVHIDLSIMEDNYQRTTKDFNKIQDQLIKAAKREVELQESLTSVEKDFCSKLTNAEREITRFEDLVNKLTQELEGAQEGFSSKNSELCEMQAVCRSYSTHLETMRQHLRELETKNIELEKANCFLIQQLRRCLDDNCTLSEEKTLLERKNCECIDELQDMHKSLMELKKECQSKNKSLACISAELTQAAVSRSELSNESQYMVSCIRNWMEEQKVLIETFTSKLKTNQQRLTQITYEKKALSVTIRRLRRANSILTQRLKRSNRSLMGRNMKNSSIGCYMIPSRISENSIKYSFAPNNTTRRISLCGNSWWFPKMEYLINEFKKSNQLLNKNFTNHPIASVILNEN